MILQLVLIIKYNNPKARRPWSISVDVEFSNSKSKHLFKPPTLPGWSFPSGTKYRQIFNLIIFITKPRQVNMKSDIVASQVLHQV